MRRQSFVGVDCSYNLSYININTDVCVNFCSEAIGLATVLEPLLYAASGGNRREHSVDGFGCPHVCVKKQRVLDQLSFGEILLIERRSQFHGEDVKNLFGKFVYQSKGAGFLRLVYYPLFFL